MNDVDLMNDRDLENALATVPAYVDVNGLPGWTLVVFSSDHVGSEEDELGHLLLLTFIKTLEDRVAMPDEIVLYHKGVLLLAADHPAAESLQAIADKGVGIHAGSESCHHYGITPAVRQTKQLPMAQIAKNMMRADKIIQP